MERPVLNVKLDVNELITAMEEEQGTHADQSECRDEQRGASGLSVEDGHHLE